MKIANLGSGVIGATAAYYLTNDGHEVTVLHWRNGPAFYRITDSDALSKIYSILLLRSQKHISVWSGRRRCVKSALKRLSRQIWQRGNSSASDPEGEGNDMPIRYLSERALERLDISTASMVASIEKAIVDMADRRAWAAPKSVVLPEDGRYVMTTLAASDDPPYAAVKIVILNPRNAARGMPSINGVVVLLDSHSGDPLALIDGKWVTAIRTAGLSLLASKYLARQDATSILFLGCGVQAHAHLSVFANTYPLKTALLFGRGQANIDRLAALAQSFGLAVRYARDANEALSEADLIVSSLTRDPSRAPFLDARLIRPGAFATITDLAEPWQQDGLATFDRIFVDDSEQERAASVKLAAPDFIRGDLSDLVLRRETGRNQDSERTAFIFRGYGLADLAIAGLALREAEKTNRGLVINSKE